MNPIQLATTIAAVALAATRLLSVTRPFWGRLPTWVRPVLPPLVLALPALYEALTGAQTWLDVATAFVTALALFLPGVRPQAHPEPPPSKPQLPFFPVALLCLLLVPSCAAFRPVVRDVNREAALLICGDFYATQKGITIDDAKEIYCKNLAPWLDAIVRARRIAGARAASTEFSGEGGAP